MDIRLLPPDRWLATREKLLAFAVQCGSGRLSVDALSLLRHVQALEPVTHNSRTRPAGVDAGTAPRQPAERESAAIAVAVEAGKLAGFAFAVDAGERACIVVVRPQMRGRGAGSALLTQLRQHYGQLACSVAADNPASMQMCFRAGMKAVGMHRGPTGKPTLRFEFSR
ncbi:GNAT family N-acetyltransferase [Paenibacillus spongiae]|uniref:GNAT family N-acetyltransferase n=1 Tax=Paenibacillus spongiae TaxID=2909671 RepID=A0ABY5SDP3_9BACL|nr:GNAT family N-acetyltransferase [Paenibacillus spongiae]UVI31879.1 GNAT family N-acetyltransferase [Paenibacillus spongiae]